MLKNKIFLWRSCHSPTCPDQHWSTLALLLHQPNWLERGSAMAHSDLISTHQSAQPWSVHSAVSDSGWCWTELSFTSGQHSNGVFTITKRNGINRNLTLSLMEVVTWPETHNIPLHYAGLYSKCKVVQYNGLYLRWHPNWASAFGQQKPKLDLGVINWSIHSFLQPPPPPSLMMFAHCCLTATIA